MWDSWGKNRQEKAHKQTQQVHVLPMHRLQLDLGSQIPGGKPVVLRGKDAAAHKHVMGVSGMGKSKFLATLVVQLLNQRIGVCLIDPHGDLADDVLQLLIDQGFYADPRAYSRVWYLDLTREDRSLPFNVLDQPYEHHKVAASVFEAWSRAWGSLAGGNAPMLEGFLKAGSFVLAQNGEPLTQLADLLTKPEYREQLLTRVHDPMVLDFFERFAETGRRGNADVGSTLRRIFNLTFSPSLRYSLGQRENRLRFRALMDQGTSLIINLGGLDPESQRMLGCLLTVGIEEASLSRVDMPEEKRTGFHLILDEFSQFSAQSSVALERVLALTRKYGLSLTLAHQTWGQAKDLESALQNATFISFRLGPDDAAWAAGRVADIDLTRTKQSPVGRPVLVSPGEQRLEWEQTLLSMPARQAVVRLGQQSYRVQTLAIPNPRCTREQLEAVKEEYARRLLRPRSEIEAQWQTPAPVSSLRGTTRPQQVAEPERKPQRGRVLRRKTVAAGDD